MGCEEISTYHPVSQSVPFLHTVCCILGNLIGVAQIAHSLQPRSHVTSNVTSLLTRTHKALFTRETCSWTFRSSHVHYLCRTRHILSNRCHLEIRTFQAKEQSRTQLVLPGNSWGNNVRVFPLCPAGWLVLVDGIHLLFFSANSRKATSNKMVEGHLTPFLQPAQSPGQPLLLSAYQQDTDDIWFRVDTQRNKFLLWLDQANNRVICVQCWPMATNLHYSPHHLLEWTLHAPCTIWTLCRGGRLVSHSPEPFPWQPVPSRMIPLNPNHLMAFHQDHLTLHGPLGILDVKHHHGLVSLRDKHTKSHYHCLQEGEHFALIRCSTSTHWQFHLWTILQDKDKSRLKLCSKVTVQLPPDILGRQLMWLGLGGAVVQDEGLLCWLDLPTFWPWEGVSYDTVLKDYLPLIPELRSIVVAFLWTQPFFQPRLPRYTKCL
jgi:hypothetical protein